MIILDLDDTLLDHSGAQHRATLLFGEQYAADILDYDARTFPELWRSCGQHYFLKFVAGALSFEAQACARIRKSFGDSTLSDAQAMSFFESYLSLYQQAWRAFDDVKPFLLAHGQAGIGVLSDGAHAQQLAKIEAMGIGEYVRFLITAESTGFAKPDPRFFHQACELGGVSPENACYIGDHFEKDALGAQAAGLRGIWLDRHDKGLGDKGLGDKAADSDIERITGLDAYTARERF